MARSSQTLLHATLVIVFTTGRQCTIPECVNEAHPRLLPARRRRLRPPPPVPPRRRAGLQPSPGSRPPPPGNKFSPRVGSLGPDHAGEHPAVRWRVFFV